MNKCREHEEEERGGGRGRRGEGGGGGGGLEERQVGKRVKVALVVAGDSGLIPGEGNNNPLQYSCLENPTDRGAWQAHGVAELDTTE